MAQFKAFYVLAVPGTRQHDIGRQVAVVENSTIFAPRSCAPTPGGNHHWPKRHSTWGVLASTVGTRRKSQGGDSDRTQKMTVLFYNSLRHGMAYHDPGASQYDERYRSRVIGNLQPRAKPFGCILHEMPAEPDMAVSWEAAAYFARDSI